MISMHPSRELLLKFAAGELPASLSTAIAIHTECCPHCHQEVAEHTEQLAEHWFDDSEFEESGFELSGFENQLQQGQLQQGSLQRADSTEQVLFSEMLNQIIADDSLLLPQPRLEVEIEVAGCRYLLPRALQGVRMSGWQRLGRFSRSRLDFNEGAIRSSLLHIAAGGAVPRHTHKGYELTQLLAGSFEDEQGQYHAGDFIMLDQRNQHAPISHDGCLCMTVADDAMQFTQGVERLFNPLIDYFY